MDPFYKELKYKNLLRNLKLKALNEKDYLSAMLLRTIEKRIEDISESKIRIRNYRQFIADYNDYNGCWFA